MSTEIQRLRDRVLEFYYGANERGVDRPPQSGDVAKQFGIQIEQASSIIAYWQQKGFLKVTNAITPTNAPTQYSAEITAAGIDHVDARRQRAAAASARPVLPFEEDIDKEFDVFISYAGEDRQAFVAPLVDSLLSSGLKVWYDKKEMTLGDTKTKAIERGMQQSRYALAIISRSFVAKQYPDHEYHTLLERDYPRRENNSAYPLR